MDGMPPETIGMQRARGVVDLHVSNGSITRFYQSGAAKALWPKTYGSMAEAVIVNTAGGVTGGDIFSYNATLENSALAVTTQAAERAYKSRAYPAQMSVKLIARNHAALHWLPQETILFDGCHLNRKIDVDIDTTSECRQFRSQGWCQVQLRGVHQELQRVRQFRRDQQLKSLAVRLPIAASRQM